MVLPTMAECRLQLELAAWMKLISVHNRLTDKEILRQFFTDDVAYNHTMVVRFGRACDALRAKYGGTMPTVPPGIALPLATSAPLAPFVPRAAPPSQAAAPPVPTTAPAGPPAPAPPGPSAALPGPLMAPPGTGTPPGPIDAIGTTTLPSLAELPPKTRNSSERVGKDRKRKKAVFDRESEAMTEATRLYVIELTKPKRERASSQSVAQKVNKLYRTGITGPTLRLYVRTGHVGEGRLPVGRPVEILKDPVVYELVRVAFATYVKLLQSHGGREATHIYMASKIRSLLRLDSDENAYKFIQRRLLRDTPELFTAKETQQEARRIAWTKACYILSWFVEYRRVILEMGFAVENGDGTVRFLDVERIINIDETHLTLDEASAAGKGGRPAQCMYDPNLSRTGRAAHKSSMSCTLMAGSTAGGTMLAPHVQLPTSATAEERQRIRTDVATHFPTFRGRFGFGEDVWLDPTFGCNEKGGFDANQFMKFMDTLMNRYPDCANVDGKRIFVKVDSGPGRHNKELILKCAERGVVLFPGVPNTTAVTQEMDQAFGPFKCQYRKSLALLTAHRLQSAGPSGQPTFGWKDFGFIMFGGTEGSLELPNVWEKAFSRENMLSAWAKCGACPLTMACLDDPQVLHEVPSGEDGAFPVSPRAQQLIQLAEANRLACEELLARGYRASILRLEAPTQKASVFPTTRRNTKERVELLASKGKGPGGFFLATGGDHLTSGDFICALQRSENNEKIKLLLREKQIRVASTKAVDERNQLLETLRMKEINPFSTEGAALLSSKDLDCLLKWKCGKKTLPEDLRRKEQKAEKWLEVMNWPAPEDGNVWTSDLENELKELREKEVTLQTSGLQKEKHKQANAAASTITGASPATKSRLVGAAFAGMSPLSQKALFNQTTGRGQEEGGI
jgi:hypothetical protein